MSNEALDFNAVAINDNTADSQFEAHVGPYVGVIQYERLGDMIVFTHTETPEELEGHGVASKLAQAALDDARAQGLRVAPLCPFVASYIKRHPEYGDLVPAEYQSRIS
ncbi:MAG TPA: GNAT family N-acetyltransferase [Ktedonobacterales bacterium]|nr:GNAT family N-acetyltransferase [Ktedonobacterales bacterium]